MSKTKMKKFCTLCAIVALAGFASCQKQQTEEERKAEIDQQVEQRLAAERQAQEKETLAQREAEVAAREKALAEQPNAAATEIPQTPRARSTSTTRETRESSDEGGDYNIFYTKLEPYGDWRETSDYGYVRHDWNFNWWRRRPRIERGDSRSCQNRHLRTRDARDRN